MTNYGNEGWERLADAILKQAAEDFKLAIKLSKKALEKGKIREAENRCNDIREVLNFVLSDWFRYLTNYQVPQLDTIYKMISKIEPSLVYKVIDKTMLRKLDANKVEEIVNKSLTKKISNPAMNFKQTKNV